MNADTVWQIIRYVLIAVGGWFASRGYVSGDQLETVVGGLGALFPVLWGLFVKFNTKAVPVKVANRADVPTVSGATGQVQ